MQAIGAILWRLAAISGQPRGPGLCTRRVGSIVREKTPDRVRLIDQDGANRGFVVKRDIAVPTGFMLRQVASDTVKLVPQAKNTGLHARGASNARPKVTTKELRLRAAIGPADLDRAIRRIVLWLKEGQGSDGAKPVDGSSAASGPKQRRQHVVLAISKESGLKMAQRHRTPDQLVQHVQTEVGELWRSEAKGTSIKPSLVPVFGPVERRTYDIACTISLGGPSPRK